MNAFKLFASLLKLSCDCQCMRNRVYNLLNKRMNLLLWTNKAPVLQHLSESNTIYSNYAGRTTIHPEINKLCSDNMEKALRACSRKINSKELAEINQTRISTPLINMLMTNHFGDMYFVVISIFIFEDRTQYVKARDKVTNNLLITNENERIIPVFIQLIYNRHRSYKEYSESIEEYRSLSAGIRSKEDEALYFKLSKNTTGHVCMCLWNLNRLEYDLFDTAHTAVGHHRSQMAMQYFFGINESYISASLAGDNSPFSSSHLNLQGKDASCLLPEENNMCVLYSFAYLICRYICDNHLNVQSYLKLIYEQDSGKLILLVAGLYNIRKIMACW